MFSLLYFVWGLDTHVDSLKLIFLFITNLIYLFNTYPFRTPDHRNRSDTGSSVTEPLIALWCVIGNSLKLIFLFLRNLIYLFNTYPFRTPDHKNRSGTGSSVTEALIALWCVMLTLSNLYSSLSQIYFICSTHTHFARQTIKTGLRRFLWFLCPPQHSPE